MEWLNTFFGEFAGVWSAAAGPLGRISGFFSVFALGVTVLLAPFATMIFWSEIRERLTRLATRARQGRG